jgi:hypothetical protein
VPEACGSLAVQVLGSSLGAVFATAAPDDGGERWRLQFGFEGFGETVAAQLARAEALFEKADFRSVRAEDYDVLTGLFSGLYDRIAGCPFVLRAGVPPDRAGRAAEILRCQARVEALLVDFGCGRILAAAAVNDGPARSGSGCVSWPGMPFWKKARMNSKRATMCSAPRGRNGTLCTGSRPSSLRSLFSRRGGCPA